MKKLLLTLMLVFLVGTACAETSVLPADTDTFTPMLEADGVTYLEWNGPILPEGTEYELLETIITGWECRLTDYDEAVHKFARIAYTDEAHQRQEAWVMAYSLNRAQPADLTTAERAQAYAMRFFSNQYVLAGDENSRLQLSRVPSGWQAELLDASGTVTHELLLTHNGHVQYYLDCKYKAPDVSQAVAHDDDLAELADSYGAHGVLEWSSRELLPGVGYNSVATIDFEEESKVFTFIIDGFDYYAALAVEPSIRMVAYGDMHFNARYGDYLSRDEAYDLAVLAMMRECNLNADEAANLLVPLQSSFCAKPYYWTNAYVPLPYWCFQIEALPAAANEAPLTYQILIDAKDGGVLEITPPEKMPNG